MFYIGSLYSYISSYLRELASPANWGSSNILLLKLKTLSVAHRRASIDLRRALPANFDLEIFDWKFI